MNPQDTINLPLPWGTSSNSLESELSSPLQCRLLASPPSTLQSRIELTSKASWSPSLPRSKALGLYRTELLAPKIGIETKWPPGGPHEIYCPAASLCDSAPLCKAPHDKQGLGWVWRELTRADKRCCTRQPQTQIPS